MSYTTVFTHHLPTIPVENPAGRKSSAKVVSFRGRPPIAAAVKTPPPTESTPVRGGRRPVSIAAREAEQQCHAEYQAVKVIPSAASRSICGVTTLPP